MCILILLQRTAGGDGQLAKREKSQLARRRRQGSYVYLHPRRGQSHSATWQHPDAYNQVWYLPTAPSRITGRQWVALFAEAMSAKPGVQLMPPWLMSILGVFIPFMKEFRPMLYQYRQDYFFDSSKFNKRFAFTTTTPQQAVKAVVGTK